MARLLSAAGYKEMQQSLKFCNIQFLNSIITCSGFGFTTLSLQVFIAYSLYMSCMQISNINIAKPK